MSDNFERIEVGYKWIGLHYHHKYIVYVNTEGDRFVVRGGLSIIMKMATVI